MVGVDNSPNRGLSFSQPNPAEVSAIENRSHVRFQLPTDVPGNEQGPDQARPPSVASTTESATGQSFLELMKRQTEIIEKLSISNVSSSAGPDHSPRPPTVHAPDAYKPQEDINAWLYMFDTYVSKCNIAYSL